MIDLHSFWIVFLGCLVTLLTRALPFLIFRKSGKTPPILTYFSKVLPYAIMGMLVVYCLKDVHFLQSPFGIPELLGCAAVAGLHIWKRNTLLSIGGGTVFYMVLVQLIF